MTTEKAKILTDDELSDGLENLVAQLGTEQDKRSHSRFVNKKQLSLAGNRSELDALYRTDWLAGKIVDIIPEDMTREWRKFVGDIEPDSIKILDDEENRLDLRSNFSTAHKYARLYGTAFIVMAIDDGQTPDKPLEFSRISEGSLKHIKSIDRHRVNQTEVIPIQDPLNRNFGMPEFYRFVETSTVIHHSRVLRFDGVELPFDEFRRNDYNSDSVLSRLYDAITNFNTTSDSAASMVYETNVDVLKVNGLFNYLQTADGEKTLRKRLTLTGMLKSFNNMLVLDSSDEFSTKTNTFAGLHELLSKYALFLSAASDIPATRLLGSSASGLNATGVGDMKNYYDTVRAAQISKYKPKLDYFDEIMRLSLGMPEDMDMSYQFNSLFQMTDKELSEMQKINAERDALYLDRDVITEAAVAKELKQSSTYTNITDDDIEMLEEFDSGSVDDMGAGSGVDDE